MHMHKKQPHGTHAQGTENEWQMEEKSRTTEKKLKST